MQCDCCRKIGPSPRLKDFDVKEIVARNPMMKAIERVMNKMKRGR